MAKTVSDALVELLSAWGLVTGCGPKHHKLRVTHFLM
jgi:hypothetical protein